MAGAYGDALPVEHRTDVVRMNAVDDEGKHGGLLARGADDAQPGMRESGFRPIGEQVVLVGGDVVDARCG